MTQQNRTEGPPDVRSCDCKCGCTNLLDGMAEEVTSCPECDMQMGFGGDEHG